MAAPHRALSDFLHTRYFPSLDGIRAISVLLVMSNHLHSSHAGLRQTPGWSGVDIFCVLSGFLITTLLLREETDTGSVRLLPFYLRRFFRIVPVFLLVLCAYVPVAYYGEHGARWHAFTAALPLYLTFMQDFVPHDAPFSSSWTLGIEEKFYFVWPLLGFMLLRAARSRALLCAGLFALSAALYLAFEQSSDRAFFHARSYAALALGSLLACMLASRFAEWYAAATIRIPTAVAAGMVILSFVALFYDRKCVLLLDVSVALLLCNLFFVESGLRAVLSSRLLVWIGRRSYSMYLIHLLIMNPLRAVLRPRSIPAELALLFVAYAVTVGVAHLIYLSVEEPARLLGKRIIAKRESTSRSAVAILDVPS